MRRTDALPPPALFGFLEHLRRQGVIRSRLGLCTGQPRDMACRSLMLQLHRAGHITLPAR